MKHFNPILHEFHTINYVCEPDRLNGFTLFDMLQMVFRRTDNKGNGLQFASVVCT